MARCMTATKREAGRGGPADWNDEMQQTLTLYKTTIGKKIAMAVAGIILIGFTLGHMAGNLQVFVGAEQFNAYAEMLKNTLPLLWGTRLALLFAFGVHIHAAVSLWQRNNAARPSKYKMQKDLATNFAAKHMLWSGGYLLLFVIIHLVHLTLGGAIFEGNDLLFIPGYVFDPTNPYNNLIKGFQHLPITILYIGGVLALGMHLFHGFWSMFQTLGGAHPKYNAHRRTAAMAIALVLTMGNLAIILAAVSGNLQPTDVAQTALH